MSGSHYMFIILLILVNIIFEGLYSSSFYYLNSPILALTLHLLQHSYTISQFTFVQSSWCGNLFLSLQSIIMELSTVLVGTSTIVYRSNSLIKSSPRICCILLVRKEDRAYRAHELGCEQCIPGAMLKQCEGLDPYPPNMQPFERILIPSSCNWLIVLRNLNSLLFLEFCVILFSLSLLRTREETIPSTKDPIDSII